MLSASTVGVNQLAIPVLVVQPDGDALVTNHAWTSLTGLDHDRALGPGWQAVVPDPGRQRLVERLAHDDTGSVSCWVCTSLGDRPMRAVWRPGIEKSRVMLMMAGGWSDELPDTGSPSGLSEDEALHVAVSLHWTSILLASSIGRIGHAEAAAKVREAMARIDAAVRELRDATLPERLPDQRPPS